MSNQDPIYVELAEYHNILKKILILLKSDKDKFILLRHNFRNLYDSLKFFQKEEKEELLTDFIKEKNGQEDYDFSKPNEEENIYITQIRDIFYFQSRGDLTLINQILKEQIEGFSLNEILYRLNSFVKGVG